MTGSYRVRRPNLVAACRELPEEVGLNADTLHLEQFGVYDDLERNRMSGWCPRPSWRLRPGRRILREHGCRGRAVDTDRSGVVSIAAAHLRPPAHRRGRGGACA